MTVGTTEDATNRDGGAFRHINHRTTCHTFPIATTVGRSHLTTHQVDDGRHVVKVGNYSTFLSKGLGNPIFIFGVHTQTVVATGTKDLRGTEVRQVIGNVYQHIAAILTAVTLTVAGISRTATIDAENLVVCFVFLMRTDIHKRSFQRRHFRAVAGFILILFQRIVIISVTTAEDGIDASLQIFDIGVGQQYVGRFRATRIMHLTQHIKGTRASLYTHPVLEVALAMNGTTKVVTAIDDITNPWETWHIIS